MLKIFGVYGDLILNFVGSVRSFRAFRNFSRRTGSKVGLLRSVNPSPPCNSPEGGERMYALISSMPCMRRMTRSRTAQTPDLSASSQPINPPSPASEDRQAGAFVAIGASPRPQPLADSKRPKIPPHQSSGMAGARRRVPQTRRDSAAIICAGDTDCHGGAKCSSCAFWHSDRCRITKMRARGIQEG
jgi:hypothetical protein